MRKLVLLISCVMFMSGFLLAEEVSFDGEWPHSWFGAGSAIKVYQTNTHIFVNQNEAYQGASLNILDLVLFENSSPSKSDCLVLRWIFDPEAQAGNTWTVAVVAQPSWTLFDIDGMKYLSFMIKANVEGLNMEVSIRDKDDAKASAGCLNKYVKDGVVGTEWKKVVIPLEESYFSGLSSLKTEQIRAIAFEDNGNCRSDVEAVQKDCILYIDNLAFKKKLK